MPMATATPPAGTVYSDQVNNVMMAILMMEMDVVAVVWSRITILVAILLCPVLVCLITMLLELSSGCEEISMEIMRSLAYS